MHTQIQDRVGLLTSSQNVAVEDSLYNSENLLKLQGRLARTSKSKRLADVILSLVGLFLLGMVFPFIALIIKISSRGPVVFKQDRVGYNGSIFQVYKFRTRARIFEFFSNNRRGESITTDSGAIFR